MASRALATSSLSRIANSTALRSATNDGQRCDTRPRSGSVVVSASGFPPAPGTRNKPAVSVPKTIWSPPPQLAPRIGAGDSPSITGGPPRIETFWSAAPLANPTHSPSGDMNGARRAASSASAIWLAMGRASSSGIAPRAITSASVGPSTSSMTRHGPPCPSSSSTGAGAPPCPIAPGTPPPARLLGVSTPRNGSGLPARTDADASPRIRLSSVRRGRRRSRP